MRACIALTAALVSILVSACVKEAQTLEEAGYGAPVGVRMVFDDGKAYEIMMALSKEEAPEKHVQSISALVHKSLGSCPKFMNEGSAKAPRRVQFSLKAGKVLKPTAFAPSKTAAGCLVKALDGQALSTAQGKGFKVMAELRGRIAK